MKFSHAVEQAVDSGEFIDDFFRTSMSLWLSSASRSMLSGKTLPASWLRTHTMQARASSAATPTAMFLSPFGCNAKLFIKTKLAMMHE